MPKISCLKLLEGWIFIEQRSKSAARFRSNKNDSEKIVLVRVKVITFYAPTGEVLEPRVKMAPGGEG